jgi:hypothetical protein
MAEWFKAAVLKTVSLKGDVGSNPTPSARPYLKIMLFRFGGVLERWPSWLKALAC